MRIGISALNMQSAAGHAKAGISRYCVGLIEGLRSLDNDNQYVIIAGPEFEPPAEWQADTRLIFVPAKGPFLGNKMVRELLVGPKWIKEFGIQAYLSTAHAIAPRPNIRKGIVVHDLFPATHPELFSKKDAFAINRVNTYSMKISDVVIANSQHTKSQIMALNGIPDQKIKVVPLGLGNFGESISRGDIQWGRLAEIGVPFDRFLFTIGTLEPRKNLPRLIEAFTRIAPDHPGLGLAIAGAKGWKDHDIWSRVQNLQVADRISFLGYVDDADIPALFAACEFFVCPSLIEGFGMPVLEAMHFGAPIVTSSGGALAEVAPQESVFFDPLSVDAIVEALKEGLRQSGERKQLVETGLARAKEFSWNRTARETLSALLD